MSHSKKVDKPKEGATLSIDVDSFVRTRDKVVTGLATLQDAIQTLSSAYIKHTNAVLGEHGAGLDVEAALSRIGDNLLDGSLGDLQPSSPGAKSVVGDDKKERKKRQHDPNAPKRPLTPFFLYMQTARPIIAADLGSDFAKGAVSAEGTRRWSTMSPEDRQLWSNAYKDNLRLYNARVHSYKTGANPNAKDMTDQEAITYAEENNIGSDATADAQLVGEANAGAVIYEEPEPAPKTPKNSRRKSKGAKDTPAAPEPIVPPAAIVPPKSAEKEKSPDKKRKRTSKKPEEKEPEKEQVVETPKSAVKPRKKKSKSDS